RMSPSRRLPEGAAQTALTDEEGPQRAYPDPEAVLVLQLDAHLRQGDVDLLVDQRRRTVKSSG
ncbi:hypothetical protein, partial [Methylobacterium longum]|uniref:hypothetical protein n=1 Tax=Methylobacterium longum TaxID=767694 RepID=UPI003F491E4F